MTRNPIQESMILPWAQCQDVACVGDLSPEILVELSMVANNVFACLPNTWTQTSDLMAYAENRGDVSLHFIPFFWQKLYYQHSYIYFNPHPHLLKITKASIKEFLLRMRSCFSLLLLWDDVPSIEQELVFRNIIPKMYYSGMQFMYSRFNGIIAVQENSENDNYIKNMQHVWTHLHTDNNVSFYGSGNYYLANTTPPVYRVLECVSLPEMPTND